MTDYLTKATFKDASIAAPEWIEQVDTRYPTFLPAQFALVSAYLDGRLRKRYPNAFVAPVSLQLVDWAARILTERVMLRRGIDASDQQAQRYTDDRTKAEAEVLEAATSNTGLWDIPLRANTRATGIDETEPQSYSETSPFAWMDNQECDGAREDSDGRGGTYR